ncbi:MAG: hypothetical protein KDD74_10620, partial [Anaerolineales bacterium]|nr:hypothetical protein [Anaerolineales bacterium]
MKSLRLLNFIIIALMLAGCTSSGVGGGGSIFATDTPLPAPQVRITPAPDAKAAVTAFFDALKNDDYEVMYAMLSTASREAITLEDFSKRWNDALNTMSASSIDVVVGNSTISPFNAEVGYTINYQTVLAGDISREIVMRLVNEDNNWKIQWDDALILPELAGGNVLAMEYSVPARGDIYDYRGQPIA